MKYVIYVFGILILTLGISFTIHSDLGTSPFDALLVGLSNKTLTVGSWEILIAILLISCNSLLKRQKPEILGLVTAFITGIGIDMWLLLLNNSITPELWYSKLLLFGVGLIIIGFGTAIYLQTNFAPIPIDRLTLIIQELSKTSIFISRTIIYLFFLLFAVFFDGPIGLGTLLTVCLGGLILNFFMKLTKNCLNRIMSHPTSIPICEKDNNHSI
ncbi:YitT family protein [Niallia taxi]|uniref:YczE/YyaS/YitT family protein n=1 Tax=Niallia taxi TaxID=2499688 RepID=UPI003D2C0BF1